MREVLHVFFKDSRQLRLPIALLLGWWALYVYSTITTLPLSQFPWRFGGPVFLFQQNAVVGLAAGWAFLIAQAVHADGPRGDRRFWLTRPHSRGRLVAAKALFVLAYVTVPFAITQAAIIVLIGLPLGDHLVGIVFTQAMWFALAVVPAIALATLTLNLPQILVAALAVVLLFGGVQGTNDLGPLQWVNTSVSVLLAGAFGGVAIWVQYFWRRPRVGLLVVLVGVIALSGAASAMPWDAAYTAQMRLGTTDALPVSASLDAPATASADAVALDPTQYSLPFTIEGLDADTLMQCEATQVTLTAPNGQRQRQPVRRVATRAMRDMTELKNACTVFLAGSDGLAPFLDGPVTIEATLYVTVFGNLQWTEVGLDRAPVQVPDAGLCHTVRPETDVNGTRDFPYVNFECYTAMRRRRAMVVFAGDRNGPSILASFPGYAPWPGDLRIAPVTHSSALAAATTNTAWVGTRPIRSHARIVVKQENVDLRAHEIRRSR